MAASARRDLFISLNGSIDNLSSAMKAGRSVLLDFNAAAGSIVDQVNTKLRDMGSGSAAGANEAVKNYESAFARIKQAMAASANDPSASLKIFDANALDAQIAKAEQAAATNRMVAETAQQVAAAGGPSAAIQLQLAAAYGTAAAKGEQEVIALRQQAVALSEVRGALGTDVIAMDEVTHGAARMSNTKMEMMHVVRASSDAFAAGAPLTQIFSMELGRLAEAAALSGGGMGKLGAVLAGPWGLAITAGLAILAPFVAKLFEGSDGADGLKDKSLTLTDALGKEAFGTDAATKAMRDYIDASKKAGEQDSLTANISLDLAAARLKEALATREAIKAQIEKARADQGKAAFVGGGQLQPVIDEGTAALKAQDNKIDALNRVIQDLRLKTGDEAAAGGKDGRAFIETRYRIEIDRQHRMAQANTEEGRKLAQVWGQTRAALEKARDAELARYDAAKAERGRRGNNTQTGRELTPTEAAGIARSAGLQVNSSSRTFGEQKRLYDAWVAAGKPADNPVAVPGTSAHEGAKGRWALDIQFGNGVTPELLRKVFADQGVSLSRVFKERGHWHVEGSRSQSDSAAATVDDSAQKEAARVAAFNQQLTQAQGEYLQAQTELSAGADEQLKVTLAHIEAERINRDAAVDRAVIAKKLTATEAGELKAVYDRTASAKSTIATNRDIKKTLDENLAVSRNELHDKMSLLNMQGDLATTTKMRRRIALQLLDLEEQERRAVAERLLASADKKDQAEGQRQINQINAEHPYRVGQIDKRNAGPLDQFRDQLKGATDDMDTALQNVAAHGLQNLEDGLLGIIDGTESVGSAFKKMASSIIADLARIAIEKLIVKAIGSIGGFSGGSVGGDGVTVENPFPFATGLIPGFAGGVIRGPGTGTSDSILGFMEGRGLIRVANGESIVTADATRRFGPVLQAMNDNRFPGFAGGDVPSFPPLPSAASLRSANASGGDIRVMVSLTDDLDARIDNRAVGVSVQVMRANTPALIEAASDHTFARANRARL